MTLLRYGVCWLLCGAGWVYAQTDAAHAQEWARLQQARKAMQQALQQQETACYQRFAVEDCLRKVRQNARQVQVGLRQQEAALNAAARRERAVQHLQEIADRQKAHAASVPPMPATARVKNIPPEPRPDDLSHTQQAQAQALVRARQQQEKRNTHQASQAKAVSAQAAQAAQARQLREEKNAAAVQRRARVLQSQADDAAAGRIPAAPLSPKP